MGSDGASRDQHLVIDTPSPLLHHSFLELRSLLIRIILIVSLRFYGFSPCVVEKTCKGHEPWDDKTELIVFLCSFVMCLEIHFWFRIPLYITFLSIDNNDRHTS